MACLVLKEFSLLEYPGLAAQTADHPDLVSQIGMFTVPHFTAFDKAAPRLVRAAPARRLFDAVLEMARQAGDYKRRVPLPGVDGTGLESRRTSRYYVKRRKSGGDRVPRTIYTNYQARRTLRASVAHAEVD
jgi:hypothetical protein